MKSKSQLVPVSEEHLRRVAKVMGPGSALAKVIAEAEKRREAGEQVEFFRDGQTIILECVPTTQH